MQAVESRMQAVQAACTRDARASRPARLRMQASPGRVRMQAGQASRAVTQEHDAGLYLVTSARYNEAKRALTDGYLDSLLVGHPRAPKTQESCFSSSINP